MLPLDPSPLRSSSACRLPACLKVVGMASGFWLFYASRFSCFDIFSDMTFDPAEVMLTLFSLEIFYLGTVLLRALQSPELFRRSSFTKTQPNKCDEK